MSADGQPDNAMRWHDGSYVYPDNEDDARELAADGNAVPVHPDRFPFDLSGLVALRARVTVTFELRSAAPLEVSENELWNWVADRMGRVTDNGPYMLRSDGIALEVDFGTQHEGPVVWLDGSAPEHGFHCGECRDPKDPDAGACAKAVPWGGGERPCQSDDAQHHGRCWHAQALGPVRLSGDVA